MKPYRAMAATCVIVGAAAVLILTDGLLRPAVAQNERPGRPARVTWEYRIRTVQQLSDKGEPGTSLAPSEQKLNDLGGEGWELVAVLPAAKVGLTDRGERYIFKRQK